MLYVDACVIHSASSTRHRLGKLSAFLFPSGGHLLAALIFRKKAAKGKESGRRAVTIYTYD